MMIGFGIRVPVFPGRVDLGGALPFLECRIHVETFFCLTLKICTRTRDMLPTRPVLTI